MITAWEKASKSDGLKMPGTKAKQAKALAYNIKWLADTFGVERVGFLTLTVGDKVNGKFVHVKERAEASRRFNSILNRIRERYRCGVVVTERHKNGGIHFHLVVALPFDARTGFDFEAVKRRDYRSVSKELREEWEWWRENQGEYGFGRHELTPIKSNGEAIGRYVGKYLGKSWEARTDDDYKGRCVRYFGKWTASEAEIEAAKVHRARLSPPMSCVHAATTPKATAWRECLRQVQWLTNKLGCELNEQNIKEHNGPRWAWRFTKQIQLVQFIPPVSRGGESVRQGIAEHNEVASSSAECEEGFYRPKAKGVWDTNLDHWVRSSVEAESRYYVTNEVLNRRWVVKSLRQWDRDRWCEHEWRVAMIRCEAEAELLALSGVNN